MHRKAIHLCISAVRARAWPGFKGLRPIKITGQALSPQIIGAQPGLGLGPGFARGVVDGARAFRGLGVVPAVARTMRGRPGVRFTDAPSELVVIPSKSNDSPSLLSVPGVPPRRFRLGFAPPALRRAGVAGSSSETNMSSLAMSAMSCPLGGRRR